MAESPPSSVPACWCVEATAAAPSAPSGGRLSPGSCWDASQKRFTHAGRRPEGPSCRGGSGGRPPPETLIISFSPHAVLYDGSPGPPPALSPRARAPCAWPTCDRAGRMSARRRRSRRTLYCPRLRLTSRCGSPPCLLSTSRMLSMRKKSSRARVPCPRDSDSHGSTQLS